MTDRFIEPYETGVPPSRDPGTFPTFVNVDPGDLVVEEAYQRDLTDSSIRQIRKIVQNFAWNRYKPPVCVLRDSGKYFVIDGQHTAIAAASHPSISEIPIMVVRADDQAARAGAFVGHNQDRLSITPMQMHHAKVTAGDPLAIAVRSVCDEAGASIVRTNYGGKKWKVGETTAVAAIGKVVSQSGHDLAVRVLRILIEARRGPILTDEIQAVRQLLTDPDRAEMLDDAALSRTIADKTPTQWKATAERTVRKGLPMPLWEATATAIFQATPKRRGGIRAVAPEPIPIVTPERAPNTSITVGAKTGGVDNRPAAGESPAPAKGRPRGDVVDLIGRYRQRNGAVAEVYEMLTSGLAAATGKDAEGLPCAWYASGMCTRLGHSHVDLVEYLGAIERPAPEPLPQLNGSIMDIKPRPPAVARSRDLTTTMAEDLEAEAS